MSLQSEIMTCLPVSVVSLDNASDIVTHSINEVLLYYTKLTVDGIPYLALEGVAEDEADWSVPLKQAFVNDVLAMIEQRHVQGYYTESYSGNIVMEKRGERTVQYARSANTTSGGEDVMGSLKFAPKYLKRFELHEILLDYIETPE